MAALITPAELRAKALRYEARAERLAAIEAMFAGRAAHAKKLGADDAIELQLKATRASLAETRCLFLAECARLAARSVEARIQRRRLLAQVVERAA